LDQLDNLTDVLKRGSPGQQKRAIAAVFERIEVDLEGEIKECKPRPWFAPFFTDLATTLDCDLRCPQGTLEADQVAKVLALMAIIPRPRPRSQTTQETL
jgi:hypothetical protein